MTLLLQLLVLCVLIIEVKSFGPSKSLPFTPFLTHKRSMRAGTNLEMRWGLKGSGGGQPNVQDGVSLRDTVPFELRGFSLPAVVFSVGVALTSFSFAGFFLNDGDGDGALSSLGFVYGIPVFLIGLSLWYAEIPPVGVETTAAADQAFDELANDTMKKIKQDVTRHRYGDDAHLDSTLEALGLKLPQKKFPQFKTIVQNITPEGELSFNMIFQSLETPFKVWNEPSRVSRYAKFFGPGVTAEVIKVDAEKRLVGLKLTTTSKSPEAAPFEEEGATAPAEASSSE